MLRRGLAYGMLFAALAGSLPAQDSSASPDPASRLLQLDVRVTKGQGPFVPGLQQDSFTVLDNGAPQSIQQFREESGSAENVKVYLIIDAVNIDYTRLSYVREQTDTFLKANDGKLAQPTALAIFTDTGTKIEPGFSTDGNAIRQAMDAQKVGLRDLRRSAGFYGAEERLQLSLKTLDELIARAGSVPGRKALIWISPGWPALSGPNVEYTSKEQQELFHDIAGLSSRLRAANVTMYSVDPLGAGENPGRTFYYEEFLKGVQRPSQASPGNLELQVLAIQSGGLALTGSNYISALLQHAFDDTKAFYSITYKAPPVDAPGEYHRIEVRVHQPGLSARTRQGYYAQP